MAAGWRDIGLRRRAITILNIITRLKTITRLKNYAPRSYAPQAATMAAPITVAAIGDHDRGYDRGRGNQWREHEEHERHEHETGSDGNIGV